ncbi:N-acetylmuramic acid 6-phosphate etherase [Granulicella rosea]|uniref:N-acetylmuramic acid 6-phosphate etherase n=1 Tax=Granulicella rosea TaxID=474952 RepID=A0A239D8H3_9BACT|nr:N-acetylmuramic acid 6-phosphate etherase [Granulicella rosea]SNS28579.1 N-acetylmuramic acid 6-phosphate etherase [Granulicella rosea]
MTHDAATTNLAALPTEARNPRSARIDELSTPAMLTVISDEDLTVATAVRSRIPEIGAAVDAIAERFERGGRLFYIGAGTSGRLGVLDASECPPTFSVDPSLFQGLIAGGDSALRRSSEGSEDSAAEGERDLGAAGFAAADTLIGIAASGRTPYVLGALDYANRLGALTVALTCVAGSAMGKVAELAIEVETGPEALTGSTRMKAGTATKMVLNMISTGVMIRTGAVYGNLMVNVQTTNAKLVDRGRRIVAAATGCDAETAARVLEEAGSVKTAIVMQRANLSRSDAEAALRAAHGVLRRALPR